MRLEDFDKLHAEGKVNACPYCGQEYVHHCYHNGDDVDTEVMPVDKAIAILNNSIEHHEAEITRHKEQLEKYYLIKGKTNEVSNVTNQPLNFVIDTTS